MMDHMMTPKQHSLSSSFLDLTDVITKALQVQIAVGRRGYVLNALMTPVTVPCASTRGKSLSKRSRMK